MWRRTLYSELSTSDFWHTQAKEHEEKKRMTYGIVRIAFGGVDTGLKLLRFRMSFRVCVRPNKPNAVLVCSKHCEGNIWQV